MYPPIYVPLMSLALEGLILLFGTILGFFQKQKKIFYFIFIITNLITNIIMNNLLILFSNYLLGLILLEILVFIIETLIYYLITKKLKETIKISLICNIASLLGGLIINYLGKGFI